jgi:putative tryptophan/tyrosine transport system substrate-binding protein
MRTNSLHRVRQGRGRIDVPAPQKANAELVVNLKTAKALGLTVPETVLARADEVIE